MTVMRPSLSALLPVFSISVLLLASTVISADKPTHAAPTVRGTLVSKAATTLTVQGEDEESPRRYFLAPPGGRLDAKGSAIVRGLTVGCEIELNLTPNGNRVTKVTVLSAPGTFGPVTGTVVGKPEWSIEIKDDRGQTERYMPRWVGEGFDKEMLQAIARRNIGDCVEIHKSVDEHLRVNTMRLLALSDQVGSQSANDRGMVIGTIVEKGRNWVTIKADGGEGQRYVPQQIVGANGALDKTILRAISALKIGVRAEARWVLDGQRRLYYLKRAVANEPK